MSDPLTNAAFEQSQQLTSREDQPLTTPLQSAIYGQEFEGVDTIARRVANVADLQPSPDQYAAARDIATALRQPLQAVQEEPQMARSQELFQRTRSYIKRNPRLSTFLSDPENAALTHDDLESLVTLSNLLDTVRRSETRSGIGDYSFADLSTLVVNPTITGFMQIEAASLEQRGAFGVELRKRFEPLLAESPGLEKGNVFEGLLSAEERKQYEQLDTDKARENFLLVAVDESRKEDRDVRLADIAEKSYTARRELLALTSTIDPDTTARYLVEATAASLQMAPGVLVGTLTRRPELALLIITAPMFGNVYYDARQRGFTPQQARAEATFFATVEALTEKVPLGIITKEGGPVLTRVLKAMGAEGIQEMIAEAIQEGYDRGVLDENDPDWFRRLVDAGIIGAGAGGMMAGAMHPVVASYEARAKTIEDAVARLRKQEHLTQVQKQVEQTKLSVRSPDKMRELLASLQQDDEVLVSADGVAELVGKGVLDNATLLEMGIDPASLRETIDRGGDFPVQLSNILTMPAEVFNDVSQYLRMGETELTSAEATAALAEREQAIKDATEQAAKAIEADPDARPIYDAIYSTLTQAGHSQTRAAQQAEIYQNHYQAAATDIFDGTVSAEQLFLEARLVLRTPRGDKRPDIQPGTGVGGTIDPTAAANLVGRVVQGAEAYIASPDSDVLFTPVDLDNLPEGAVPMAFNGEVFDIADPANLEALEGLAREAGIEAEDMDVVLGDPAIQALITDLGFVGARNADGTVTALNLDAVVTAEDIAEAIAMVEQLSFQGTGSVFAPEPGAPLGRVDLSFMGTGEGAQVYGWGAYLAEKRSTGEWYRETVGGSGAPLLVSPTGTVYNESSIPWLARHLAEGYTLRTTWLGAMESLLASHFFRVGVATGDMKYLSGLFRDNLLEYFGADDKSFRDLQHRVENGRSSQQRLDDHIELRHAVSEMAQTLAGFTVRPVEGGQLYTVNIDDAAVELMFDETRGDGKVGDQDPRVRKAIYEKVFPFIEQHVPKKHLTPNFDDALDMKSLHFILSTAMEAKHRRDAGKPLSEDARLPRVSGVAAKQVSMFLLENGIKGRRYWDGTSRRRGEGTSNFVVWDESAMTVVARNDEHVGDFVDAAADYVDAISPLFQEDETADAKTEAAVEAGLQPWPTDRVEKAEELKALYPAEAVDVSSLDYLAVDSAPPADKVSTMAVAGGLHGRSVETLGENAGEDTPENQTRIAQTMALEAEWLMSQPGSGADWYKRAIRRAHRVAAIAYPDLLTDPQKRAAFNYALAVTSNGQDVLVNVRDAMFVYDKYSKSNTGHMPDFGTGERDAQMRQAFEFWNEYVDKYGIEWWLKFLNSEWTVQQIKAMGFEVSGELVDATLPGSVIIGPKIGGAFFANLQGRYDVVTMDLWWMRSWGRYTGTLLVTDPERISASEQVLIEAISTKELRIIGMSREEVQANPALAAHLLHAYFMKPVPVLDKDGNVVRDSKGKPKKKTYVEAKNTEGARAARNHDKLVNMPVQAPSSGKHRKQMRAAAQQAVDLLAARGIETDLADMQAILWYGEKALYSALGARATNREDFAGGVAKVLKEKGYDPALIEAALRDEGAIGSGPGGAGDSTGGLDQVLAGLAGGTFEPRAQRRYFNLLAGRRIGPGLPSRNVPGVPRSGPFRRAGGQGHRLHLTATPPFNEEGELVERRVSSDRRVETVKVKRSENRRPPKSKAKDRRVETVAARSVTVYTPRSSKVDPKDKTEAVPLAIFKATRATPLELLELEPGEVSAQFFHNALKAAKAATENRGAVELKELSEYAKLRLFVTRDGQTGFALNGDDIVSVFNRESGTNKSAVQQMMMLAVQEGGRRLDAFDGVLPYLYSTAGFRAVSRVLWNDKHAPKDWNYELYAQLAPKTKGRPDIVMMVYDPDATVYEDEDVKGYTYKEYDDALAIQQAEVQRLATPLALEQNDELTAPNWKTSGDLHSPVLKIDNPGGDWLKGKQARVDREGRTEHGAPFFGDITGWFDGNALVPVELLAALPGMQGEQARVRPQSIEWLTDAMQDGTQLHPPFIQVSKDGEAWVSEGNHRIMVAKDLGISAIPVEIRYFDGGEQAAGPLSPDLVRAQAATAQETVFALEQNDELLPQFKEFDELAVAEAGTLTFDGLTVGDTIPNLGSIGATFNNPEQLPGVRMLPLEEWGANALDVFTARDDIDRSRELGAEIQKSKRIDPLIVQVDEDGKPYILEGNHRLAALMEIGAHEFPALIVTEGGQPKLPQPQTATPEFQAWFRPGGKPSYVTTDNTGEGPPKRVLHGGTHEIESFTSSSEFAKQNYWGDAYYFTDSVQDVNANYAAEEGGADLQNRVENTANNMVDYLDQLTVDEAVEQFQTIRDLKLDVDNMDVGQTLGELFEYDYLDMLAEGVARERVHGGAPNITPVFLRMNKPADLRRDPNLRLERESVLDVEWEQDEEGNYVGEPTGALVDFAEAIDAAIEQEVEPGLSIIPPEGGILRFLLVYGNYESMSLADAVNALFPGGVGEASPMNDLQDETGQFVGRHVMRVALERLGYDGIIMDAGVFQSMEGTQGTTHYIAFRPTQIKSAVGNRGGFDPKDPRIVYQGAKGGARGAYIQERNTYGDISNVIQLTENQNLSTFLHETGHFWLFEMYGYRNDARLSDAGRTRLEERINATKDWFAQNSVQALKDLRKMHKSALRSGQTARAAALGAAIAHADANGGALYLQRVAAHFMDGSVEHGTTLEMGFHEQWARGFEKYLGEGVAPSSVLKRAFQEFAGWLARTYSTLKRLNVNLTPQAREVMDLLLATEEALQEAKQAREADVPDVLDPYLTPQQREALHAAAAEAERQAREQLIQLQAQAQREKLTEAYKAAKERYTDEEFEALYEDPLYRARRLLRDGILPNGNKAPAEVRLERDEVQRFFGKAAVRAMPSKTMTKKGEASAYSIEALAKMVGFEDGGALIEALTTAHEVEKVAVAQRVEARLRREFGTQLDGDELREAAAQAVDNDAQTELVALRLRILRGLTSQSLTEAAERRAETEGVSTSPQEDAAARRGAQAVTDTPEAQAEALAAEAVAKGNRPQRRAQVSAGQRYRAMVRALDLDAARAAAAAQVQKLEVGKLTPQQYRLAAFRHGRAAAKALAARDVAAALDAMQQQLINMELSRAVAEAQGKVEKRVKKWKRLQRRSDKRLAVSYDMDTFATVRQIVGVMGIDAPARGVAPVELAQQSDEQRKRVEDAELLVLQANSGRTSTTRDPYEQLTFADFTAIHESIEATLSEARDATAILLDGRRVTFDQILDEMAVLNDPRKPQSAGAALGQSADRKAREWQALGQTFRMQLRRVESWAVRMDNGNPDGPYTKYIVRPIADAVVAYKLGQEAVMKRLLDVLTARGEVLAQANPIDAREIGWRFKNKAELLHALMHSGNESNLRKLLIGGQMAEGETEARKWGQLNDDGVLDSTQWFAFLNRAMNDGTLTKADMDLAQEFWDIAEDMKPAAQEAHRRAFGYYFPEVEATPLQTPWGQYRGGYVPAISDSMMNPDAGFNQAADQLMVPKQAGALPGAEKGFTNQRVEYNEPLLLDLTMLPVHFDTVLKFTHFAPVVRNVGRLVSNKKFTHMHHRTAPEASRLMLLPWLERVARQQTVTSSSAGKEWDRKFNNLNRAVGQHYMFMNVVNMAQQLTGFFTAAVQLPVSQVFSGMMSTLAHPQVQREYVSNRSPFMRLRMDNSVNEAARTVRDFLLDPTPMERANMLAGRHAYFLQQGLQNWMDPAVWLAGERTFHKQGHWQAAFDKAVARGLGPNEAVASADAAAVRFADSQVRQSQAAMEAFDISVYEVGDPMWRITTKFMTYFNAMLNLNITAIGTEYEVHGMRRPGKMLYLVAMGITLPAVLAEAMSMAMRGDFDDLDDDEPEELAVKAAQLLLISQVKLLAGGIPFGSMATGALQSVFTSATYDDKLSISPVVGPVEQIVSGGRAVVESVQEGELVKPEKVTRAALASVAMLFGLPTNWLSKAVGYGIKVEEGRAEPEGPLDILQGVLSGRDGTEK